MAWILRIETDIETDIENLYFFLSGCKEKEDLKLHGGFTTISGVPYFKSYCLNYLNKFYHKWCLNNEFNFDSHYGDINDIAYLEYLEQGSLLEQIKLFGLRLDLRCFDDEIKNENIFLDWHYSGVDFINLGLL